MIDSRITLGAIDVALDQFLLGTPAHATLYKFYVCMDTIN